MPGILSLGGHIPRYRYRLSSSALSAAWGGGPPTLGRPVANHGEDTLTMAHEALASVMEGRDPRRLDSLFFAPPSTGKNQRPDFSRPS